MNQVTVVAFALVIFGWALTSKWWADRNVTAPLILLVAGLVLANPSWGIVDVDVESSTVHHLAELTLGLILFSDASKVSLSSARKDVHLTARLLGIGLPLSMLLGTVAAEVAFPTLPLALSALIAASLAPTDAALSASVITDDRLPQGVRRVLNEESGLNDGIATPVVTFCIAAAATALEIAGAPHEDAAGAFGTVTAGIGMGAGVALVGGRLLAAAHRRGWLQPGARRVATLALALGAFLAASEVGANPFVAAFVGGLTFGAAAPHDVTESVELTELAGNLLSLVVWFIFGAAFVLPAFEHLDARVVIYAALSLTVIRMVPVALALIGASQDIATTAFVGWFGPRGLASVVFGLLAIEDLGEGHPSVTIVVRTIAVTVVASVVAHGVTARPLATRYVRTHAVRD